MVIMGHYHQYISIKGAIVNGSLKGYDEYAMGNRFAFEIPKQALWFTHPRIRGDFPSACNRRTRRTKGT